MHYIIIKKILKKRHYKKYGYIVLRYITDASFTSAYPSGVNIEMTTAFTYPEFYYIGNSKWAYRLCALRGIKPQPINPIEFNLEISKIEKAKNILHNIELKIPYQICQIGFCEKEQKWYGWSHRAIYGFGIGSIVRKGDCAYRPKDKMDLLEEIIDFYIDSNMELLESKIDVPDPQGENDALGCYIKYKSKTKSGNIVISECWESYPEIWGKGEWVAKTLEEAKQMAIDFARGVA